MEVITSTQNHYVKLARSLAKKKFRDRSGLVLLEGINLLRDMPAEVNVKFVLATEQRAGEAEDILLKRGLSAEGERTLDFTRAHTQIYYISEEIMQSVCDTVSPYGIAAVCEVERKNFALPLGNALLLDGVSDPGNVGTLIRTAAACGFNDVYLLDCADVFSPKVLRASLGGVFRVRAYEVSEEEALRLVVECGGAVLDMYGENLLRVDIPSPVLFVAGNEAHGVRDSVKRIARKTYSLPMRGDMESLNVAVAASVAMYMTVK